MGRAHQSTVSSVCSTRGNGRSPARPALFRRSKRAHVRLVVGLLLLLLGARGVAGALEPNDLLSSHTINPRALPIVRVVPVAALLVAAGAAAGALPLLNHTSHQTHPSPCELLPKCCRRYPHCSTTLWGIRVERP